MKLTTRKGYTFVQETTGDGIVNIIARKIDGSEEDAYVAKFVDGKFVIPGADGELEKSAKLVYQVIIPTEDDKFGIYASEETHPTEEDFDIINATDLCNYVTVDGLELDPSF